MNDPNDMNNDCVRQLSYPDDFDDANQLVINLPSQSRIQDFHTSDISFSIPDNMSMSSIDYRDTETYTDDYALYQGNLSEGVHQSNVDTPNEQLNTPLRGQVETHTNPGLIPVSFQTFCAPSVPYSDININPTNGGLTNDHSQHF
ncbi:8096_t:CDS:1, partial [Paraglomus occultum]